ncbi:sigma-54-dependent transcriptional regulator [Occallatibacter savannae]|uniref:sigma-54-dependent transcriptional regulator n=1 Tax=Occallatibacter savannae TaxID=1002691 RepID=UPI000D68FE8D|nr:helix-turn-helix domain-containing protein [Occallatibacter savannae]
MPTLDLAAPEALNAIDEDHSESTFIAASPSMSKLLHQANIVAPHLRICTIEGEPGSGKHTLARHLYRIYRGRHSEIEPWGFSRCDARNWLLSQIDPQSLAGFIFLDRVDLLSGPAQALLLRVLKDLDFRQSTALVVLASSESPLRELARNSQFLTDLALRLTSIRLCVPPLRERREDLVPLANRLLLRIAARYRIQPVVLTSGAIARLLEHPWPGNLRELFSTLESAVIESSGGIIRAEDLSLPIRIAPKASSIHSLELLNLDAVMHQHIRRVLDLNHGNKLRTARQLGISRSTLYRLLEKRLSFSA